MNIDQCHPLLRDLRRHRKIAAALLLAALGTDGVLADTYPSKPIRLIVPFSAGGTSDLMGRVVGARLGEALGQTVVVDNRGGSRTLRFPVALGHENAARSIARY